MDFKPIEGRKFPRFSAIKTFFRLPAVSYEENFDVALFGVPFDGGATFRPGQRFAPASVRDISSLGRGYHWARNVDFTKNLKVADVGDCPVDPLSLEETYKKIESFTSGIIESKKRFVACGGDHSITLPILRALKKHYKTPLGLIHFDAHFDTYPPAWNHEYHHGTFVRHAVEEKLLDPTKILQIGVRGPHASSDDPKFVEKNKINLWTMDDIRTHGVASLVKQFPSLKGVPVYLSFDVDALDPSVAPGTGTPVIGGMNTYEAQQILRHLPDMNLVGADVVEVAPQYDPTQITQLAAVDVMFEVLSFMAQKK